MIMRRRPRTGRVGLMAWAGARCSVLDGQLFSARLTAQLQRISRHTSAQVPVRTQICTGRGGAAWLDPWGLPTLVLEREQGPSSAGDAAIFVSTSRAVTACFSPETHHCPPLVVYPPPCDSWSCLPCPVPRIACLPIFKAASAAPPSSRTCTPLHLVDWSEDPATTFQPSYPRSAAPTKLTTACPTSSVFSCASQVSPTRHTHLLQPWVNRKSLPPCHSTS